MVVTREEWEQVHNMIAKFEIAESGLSSWRPLTSAHVFYRKEMLERVDKLIYDMEEIEREMEII